MLKETRTLGARAIGAFAVALASSACVTPSADHVPRVPREAAPDAQTSECLREGTRRVRTPAAPELSASDAGYLTLRQRDLPDDVTVDLRGLVFLADQDSTSPTYSPRPLNIGDGSGPSGLCVLAPFVRGTQGRDLDWEYLKHDPGRGDHPALRVGGVGWTVVDGARFDNVMNGFRPAGEGLVVRNAFLTHVRDDCVANDDLRALRIEDSLFDGCYTAVSARPERRSPLWDGPRVSTTMELERVLIRLAPMPGGHNVFDPTVSTYGHLWKWSDVAGDTVIRDSVILVEGRGAWRHQEELAWPDNVRAENVTVVWTGVGEYPGELPAHGVTVVRDRAVWRAARDLWLSRHGCTTVDRCDPDKLVSPDPPS